MHARKSLTVGCSAHGFGNSFWPQCAWICLGFPVVSRAKEETGSLGASPETQPAGWLHQGGEPLNAGCNSITEDPLPLLELPGVMALDRKGQCTGLGEERGQALSVRFLMNCFYPSERQSLREVTKGLGVGMGRVSAHL